MRKLTALIASTMLAFSLAACGGGGTSDIQEPSEVSSEDVAQTDDEEAVDEDAPEESSPAQEATIEETVLLDEAGVKVTAKSLESNWYGPQIKLLVENNSGKNLTVQSRNESINGYMCETMFSCDVDDGKKANDTLTFSENQLELSGVDSIAEMEFSLHIFDQDTWDAYYDSDPIVLKTSIAGSYEQAYDDSGEVAYDDNGVKIVVKGRSDDSSWLGPSVIVEVVNTRNDIITVQARNTSINGFMIEPFFSADVCPGKRVLDGITFASSDLEDNDIEEIESVELSFHVCDANSFDDIVDTGTVTINF